MAGALVPAGELDVAELSALTGRMSDTLGHRGPDGRGAWVDARAGIGLAHTRLAVVDLTSSGRQPMRIRADAPVLVCNGEIYNHLELRRELESAGHRFRGRSDSEVLAALIDRHGLPAALERVNGAFALALWDPATATLQLARDRIGEKPLYYGWCGEQFVFASELKALRAHPSFRTHLDRRALALYFAHGYVPAPYCVYSAARKLRPGCLLTLRVPAAPGDERISRYWSLPDIAATGGAGIGSHEELAEELDQVLRDSVSLRSAADVRVGVFLSGGVDSAAVATLMARESAVPLRTFTAGFEEPDFDERAAAHAVARMLGSEHVDVVCTAREALRLVERMPRIYDEPFYDPAQLPTVLLAQEAATVVKVVQSGEGSDELFGGYPPYLAALRDSVAKAEAGLSGRRAFDLHAQRRIWADPAIPLLGAADPAPWLADALGTMALGDAPAGLLLADALTWLPDNCMVKMDRATMAAGLEVRCPYLDPRLIELAFRIPFDLKVTEAGNKLVLRRALRRHLPGWAREQPKRGFNLPLAAWLRGALREWAETLLDRAVIEEGGLIDAGAVRARWKRHLDGSDEHTYELWTVLVFQNWLPYGTGGAIASDA
ncbi:asparagine synthase (glutamine-hydrolyzing) [Nonomuraea sp. NPDC048881]|uniref:asparagine synthase (glutamine-hydrolyzing) n=1 Tax=Nonomuraea sp. NPDC048881 TaxID=3155030 RepID=UPI0034046063